MRALYDYQAAGCAIDFIAELFKVANVCWVSLAADS